MDLTFEKKIKDLLEEQRKTRKALAEHLSMTPQGVDAMLKNNTISAVKLQAVAEFFGVEVTHFYGLPPKPVRPGAVEGESYMRASFDRLESMFTREVEQKNSQIAGLQRMVDYLMQGQPQPKTKPSFLKPVTMTEDAPVRKLNSKMQAVKTA